MTLKLVLDSGANKYYIYNKDWFLNYKIISNKNIKITNNETFPVISQKNIPIKINNNNLYIETIIKNIFYISKFNINLINSKELINKN
jgi:hypothetical protein